MNSALDQSLFYHQKTLKENPGCMYVVKQAGLECGRRPPYLGRSQPAPWFDCIPYQLALSVSHIFYLATLNNDDLVWAVFGRQGSRGTPTISKVLAKQVGGKRCYEMSCKSRTAFPRGSTLKSTEMNLGHTVCRTFFTTYRLIFLSASIIKKVTNRVTLSFAQFLGCLPIC